MSVLPPEPERKPAAQKSPATQAVRPKDFGTLRARFSPPAVPAAKTREPTPAEHVARLLEGTRRNRPPDKEMIDVPAVTGDVQKDSPASWERFHALRAAKEARVFTAAALEPPTTASADRSGDDRPIGEDLEKVLDNQRYAFATSASGNETFAGPHPVALGYTEVRAGKRGSDQAGLLRWQNPPATKEVAEEGGQGGPVPDTGHMSTAFGGSTGKGIFVLTQGKLHVADTKKYAALFGEPGAEAYHSSITGGRPVEAAGEIEIKDGRVLSISNLSGHYRPGPEHMLTTLAWLSGRGLDVSKVKVGILDREYDATAFVEAGGDVTALESDALAKRGVTTGKDPVTGRTTASITHRSEDTAGKPTVHVLDDLSIAAQQEILAQPPGALTLDAFRNIRYGEEDRAAEKARSAASAANKGTAGGGNASSKPVPTKDFTERRATVSTLLSGRRRGKVAPIKDRFQAT